MVNNFTNSNKMNNHLKSLSTKKTTTYVNEVLTWHRFVLLPFTSGLRESVMLTWYKIGICSSAFHIWTLCIYKLFWICCLNTEFCVCFVEEWKDLTGKVSKANTAKCEAQAKLSDLQSSMVTSEVRNYR
jgi:ABC-type transport system involved in Fe-S cluster assembly fused permease/ATPase subunit